MKKKGEHGAQKARRNRPEAVRSYLWVLVDEAGNCPQGLAQVSVVALTKGVL